MTNSSISEMNELNAWHLNLGLQDGRRKPIQ